MDTDAPLQFTLYRTMPMKEIELQKPSITLSDIGLHGSLVMVQSLDDDNDDTDIDTFLDLLQNVRSTSMVSFDCHTCIQDVSITVNEYNGSAADKPSSHSLGQSFKFLYVVTCIYVCACNVDVCVLCIIIFYR